MNGPIVVIPARIAAALTDRLRLAKLRVDVRGQDAELDSVLLAIALVAASWRNAIGTTVAIPPEPAPPFSSVVSSITAASIVGVTDRAVRKAIAENRLPASKVGGRWRIDRVAVEHYRATRRTA